MRLTYRQKIDKAKLCGIDIPNILLCTEQIVGIYKFCYYNPQNHSERGCFYVGKSTNIAYRLLDCRGGHIHNYLNGHLSDLVPSKIEDYLKKGYKIEVFIREVDYRDTYFSRASHRLALAELEEIVQCQKEGQCLEQMPEGVGYKEKVYWEKNYKGNYK